MQFQCKISHSSHVLGWLSGRALQSSLADVRTGVFRRPRDPHAQATLSLVVAHGRGILPRVSTRLQISLHPEVKDDVRLVECASTGGVSLRRNRKVKQLV